MTLPDGIQLKLDRANEHCDALEKAVVPWNKPGAYRFVPDVHDDPRESYVEFRYVIEVLRPLPKRWMSQVLGDAINNYRCVLDHLVWELSIAESGDPPPKPKRIAFPSDVSDPVPYGLHAVNAAVVTEIKSLFTDCTGKEPGAPSPFWMLCELSNVDKHSSIHVVHHHARNVGFTISPTIIGTRIETLTGQAINDETTILATAFVPRPLWRPHAVKMHGRAEHGIAIAETSRTPLAHFGQTVDGIREAVEEAAKRLGNLLP
jgi:hypothetical protein